MAYNSKYTGEQVEAILDKANNASASKIEDIYPDVENLLPCFYVTHIYFLYADKHISVTGQAGKRMRIPAAVGYTINLPNEARYDDKEYKFVIYNMNPAVSVSIPNWARFGYLDSTKSDYTYRHEITFVNGVGTAVRLGCSESECIEKTLFDNNAWYVDGHTFHAPFCYHMKWGGDSSNLATSDDFVLFINLGPFKVYYKKTLTPQGSTSHYTYELKFRIEGSGEVEKTITLQEGVNADDTQSELFTNLNFDWFFFYDNSNNKYHSFVQIWAISQDDDTEWLGSVVSGECSLDVESTVNHIEKTTSDYIYDRDHTLEFVLNQLAV